MPRNRDDDGYATLTAVVLCAVLSLLCVAALSLHQSRLKAARAEFKALQDYEALKGHSIRVATELMGASDIAQVTQSITVPELGDINVRAEPEGPKWGFRDVEKVDEATLASKTSLKIDYFKARLSLDVAGIPQKDDCLRSLFSPVGYGNPKPDLKAPPRPLQLSNLEGTVWRIRIRTKSRVLEHYIRYSGDALHPFRVISEDYGAVAQFPDCTALKAGKIR